MILDTPNPVQVHDRNYAPELAPILLAVLSAALNEFKGGDFCKIYYDAEDNYHYPCSYCHIGQVENVRAKSNQTEVDKVNHPSECHSIK